MTNTLVLSIKLFSNGQVPIFGVRHTVYHIRNLNIFGEVFLRLPFFHFRPANNTEVENPAWAAC